MGGQIQQHKSSAVKKSKTICAWLDRLTAEIERNLGQQIRLIFFADAGCITRTVHHRGEGIEIIGKAHPAGIAELSRIGLSAKEDGLGNEFRGNVRGLEHNFLARGIIGLNKHRFTSSGREEY